MPIFELKDGGEIRYEIIGNGEPIVVTPGGIAGLDKLWPLAHELSREFEVLLWDRRNTMGESTICFDGKSEGGMWVEDLAQLVDGLEIGPLHVLGGSGGSRMSLLFAIAYPEKVRKLAIWNAVGGWFAATILAGGRYTPFIRAAWRGGMEEVAKESQMAALIEANPRNRELLMKWDPQEFIARMKEWARFYLPEGDKVLTGGMTEEMLEGLGMPTLIFENGDDTHPPELTQEYHRLIPDSTLITPARWDSHDWWTLFEKGEHFAVWQELAPQLIDFLKD